MTRASAVVSNVRALRQATRPGDFNSDDRLALTIVVAIVLHAMVLLGVSFAPEPKAPSRFESMEVILVAEKSARAPKEAKLLSQANLEGGGDTDDELRPSAPVKAPLPAPTAAVASPPPPPARARPAPPVAQPAPAPARQGRTQVKDHVARVARQGELPVPHESATRPTQVRPEAPPEPQPEPQPVVDNEPLPDGAQQLVHSFAIANLSAEIQEKLESRAKRPRRKYVSATTQEYRYAAYMEAWRAKVERIGNINYPEEARRRRLAGTVMLDVAVNRDGSVGEISIRKSSGITLLDDAAVRSVHLAAPYDPLPPEIRKEVDELHVTRTWKFFDASGVSVSR
jgi:protein TonB